MRRSNASSVRRGQKNRGFADCKDMDSFKSQFRHSPPSRLTHFFSRYRSPKQRNSKWNLIIIATTITIVALLCYFYAFPWRSSNGSNWADKWRFKIVIDGGSTGTRIHVFEYAVKHGTLVCDFGGKGWDSMRVNPGLSVYGDDPQGAERSLADLIEFGKKKVPREYWKETEIRLMATAGMRMLEVESQRRILESCRRVLRSAGFKFHDDWASVISGADEGIYAWVVANYARGTLGVDPSQTTGIIELGGASAQVTFVSRDPLPPEYSYKVNYRNFTYNLYSHSFLQFGQNAALDLLRESLFAGGIDAENLLNGDAMDPCTPKGYKHQTELWKLSHSSLEKQHRALLPSGNFSKCRAASWELLQRGRENCSFQHCLIGSAFIPKLKGKFLATENFFFTSKFFGLAPQAFLSELMMAGKQFCEEDWSNIKKKYPSLEEEVLLHYCFSSAYIVALLHDSLGIPLDDSSIVQANSVGDIPLDWALGAFILQTAAELDVGHSNWITSTFGHDFSTLLVLVGISLVLIFAGWSLSRWKNVQFRTVYDLEKGKYIVSRIGRSS